MIALSHLAQPRVTVRYMTNAPAAYRILDRAVERACAQLGVQQPVYVYLSNSRRGRWAGSHRYDERARRHEIMLARWLNVIGVSKTLWHELTHAAQHERGEQLEHGMTSTRRARMPHEQYMTLPGEREAHENEALAASYPLASGQ